MPDFTKRIDISNFRSNWSVFLLVLLFSLNGCSESKNTSVNESPAQTRAVETSLAPLQQYELIETPKYKALKKQVEDSQKEVDELKNKRDKLIVVYVDEAVEVKQVSLKLYKAKAKLRSFQELLDEEFKQLEISPKNNPL